MSYGTDASIQCGPCRIQWEGIGRRMNAADQKFAARYPSRTMIFWRGSWAAGAPAYPAPPVRYPRIGASEWLRLYRESIEAHERYKAWWQEKRDVLPGEEETGGWREFRCSLCHAHLADVRPATRGTGIITPELGHGLGTVAFHLGTPAAILVEGLTRELDHAGKQRRDSQGRPCFGAPRRHRFRRGLRASSDGVPRPFIRHARGPVIVHCPGCGRANELHEPG